MNPILGAFLLLLAVYAAMYVLLWLTPATWERIRTAQYRRETARLQAAARGSTPVSRWLGVGELITGIAYRLAVKVLRLDRKEADRG